MRTSTNDHPQNVREIQQYLRLISSVYPNIPLINSDGIYGSETTEAVRQFQENTGLMPTGMVDLITFNKLVEVHAQVLEESERPLPFEAFPLKAGKILPGSESDAVYPIQLMLGEFSRRYHNLPSVQITGVYDAETEAAVRAFQQLQGLPVTGEVNKPTWNAMVRLYTVFVYNP